MKSSSSLLVVITVISYPHFMGSSAHSAAFSQFGDSPRDKGDVTRVEAATSLFEFHSGFWLNLHHFLYQQALVRNGNIRAARSCGEAPLNKKAAPEGDPAWTAALDYYVAAMIKRDLLFDQGMVDINDRLAQLGEGPVANVSGLDSTLISRLAGAAPVYRSFWWKEHDLANQTWVARIAPLLSQMGGEISARLMSLYHTKWPKGGVRVEMASYANWAGAYTSQNPLLITMSSEEKPDRRYEGLEMLFHEASHGFDSLQEQRIATECKAQNKRPPRNLWHAMIFYTTGDVVKKMLAEHQFGAYKPYAYQYGIYDRGWKDYLEALEAVWQPYLDGKTDFEHALSRLVAEVAPDQLKHN